MTAVTRENLNSVVPEAALGNNKTEGIIFFPLGFQLGPTTKPQRAVFWIWRFESRLSPLV